MALNYEHVHELVKRFAGEIPALKADVILAVMRGGAIPALMLSHRLSLPLTFVNCNRGETVPRFLGDVDLRGKTVLIVDDFAMSGNTLRLVKDAVTTLGGTAKTLALYYVPNDAPPPDLGLPADRFVLFPWDRLEVTPSSRELFATVGSRYTPAQVTDFYGVDLDGVLCADLPRRWYSRAERIPTLLTMRDGLRPNEAMPSVPREHSVVITARPVEDFARTREWLDRHYSPAASLVCRDPKHFGSGIDDSGRYKAAMIRELGVSVFYESDLQQALIIAQAHPSVDVIWWGKNKKLRVTAATI